MLFLFLIFKSYNIIYNTLKAEYDNLLSNSINLGNVINLEDIEKVNIDKLIKSLML